MKSTAVGSTANKINYEIKWPKEPLSTFICLKVGLNKVIPPKSNKFGILFCLCPDPGIWLTVGVMILECQKVRVYADPNSIPNKEHPLSAECNPCTRSVSLKSYVGAFLCYAWRMWRDAFPFFSRSVQLTVITIAAFLYHLNWIYTVYTIICYAHVGSCWPYSKPSRCNYI